MYFTKSEINTIKRAFIIYDKSLYRGLLGKGFFIDPITCKIDIENMVDIKRKLNFNDIY